MNSTEIRRWLVSGRVQGVFFRASTRRHAESLGLTGHAINLDDGRVEVVAAGEPAAVEKLERWLATGPAEARVESVQRVDAPAAVPGAFKTG